MTRTTDAPDLSAITAKLAKLQVALAGGLPREQCLRRWSAFIRERDGHRCVDCHSRESLSAHHLCHKSFLAEAEFRTGNGITLYSTCHREMHQGFNARPDLSVPMDAQGGVLGHGAALQHPDGRRRRARSYAGGLLLPE